MQGLLLIFLIGTGLIFFLQNRQPIQVNFFGTTAESALASFTLPLGLWVVLFLTLGVLASVLINALGSLGQPKARPQNLRPNPPRRSPPESFEPPPPPTPPPSPQQAPEPVTMEEEWDWDEPEPDLADWSDPKPPARPRPMVQDSPRLSRRNRENLSPETMGPTPAMASDDDHGDRGDHTPSPPVAPEEIAPPPPREPLPDLRQFEAPQTPQNTKREGTIYSQQYRPARPKADKNEQSDTQSPGPRGVYDAPYRIINSAPNPPGTGESNAADEEEDWI
ncbi:LapA family protein [Synechocystis sp. FACHB-383]|nr:LapA family protein [Synechocystis sp. FACHB-383]MBD2655077.1 LapA family protein [Synechocystis sp. FACHB-383]